jgi:hypothetical protein
MPHFCDNIYTTDNGDVKTVFQGDPLIPIMPISYDEEGNEKPILYFQKPYPESNSITFYTKYKEIINSYKLEITPANRSIIFKPDYLNEVTKITGKAVLQSDEIISVECKIDTRGVEGATEELNFTPDVNNNMWSVIIENESLLSVSVYIKKGNTEMKTVTLPNSGDDTRLSIETVEATLNNGDHFVYPISLKHLTPPTSFKITDEEIKYCYSISWKNHLPYEEGKDVVNTGSIYSGVTELWKTLKANKPDVYSRNLKHSTTEFTTSQNVSFNIVGNSYTTKQHTELCEHIHNQISNFRWKITETLPSKAPATETETTPSKDPVIATGCVLTYEVKLVLK